MLILVKAGSTGLPNPKSRVGLTLLQENGKFIHNLGKFLMAYL